MMNHALSQLRSKSAQRAASSFFADGVQRVGYMRCAVLTKQMMNTDLAFGMSKAVQSSIDKVFGDVE